MKEISPFNEEEISFLVAFNAFRTSPFIAAIKEFKETLNDKGAPIDWRSTHKGKVIQLLTGQPRNRIATVLFLRCYRPFSIPLWIELREFSTIAKPLVAGIDFWNETNAKLRKRTGDIKTYTRLPATGRS